MGLSVSVISLRRPWCLAKRPSSHGACFLYLSANRLVSIKGKVCAQETWQGLQYLLCCLLGEHIEYIRPTLPRLWPFRLLWRGSWSARRWKLVLINRCYFSNQSSSQMRALVFFILPSLITTAKQIDMLFFIRSWSRPGISTNPADNVARSAWQAPSPAWRSTVRTTTARSKPK